MEECYMRGMEFPLGKEPVNVDVGANVGFFTLFALSELNARVVSYEPIPANFRQLKHNLEMNRFPVICFQKGRSRAIRDGKHIYNAGEGFTTDATNLRDGSREHNIC